MLISHPKSQPAHRNTAPLTFLKTGLAAITLTALAACSDSADHTPPVETPAATASAPNTPAPPPSIDAQYQDAVTTLSEHPSVKAAFTVIESDRALNNKNLIEINEIPAPPFGEEKRVAHVAEMFKALGVADVTIDAVGNVLARRPGRIGARTVALVAHIDTVFPIETDVTVRQDGDTYIAPGIGDNSRGLVVLLSLLKAMDDAGIETDDDVLFVGNVGEEGLGDLRGVKHLYRDGADPIDTMIAIDGGQLERLIYGGVGSYRYRVTFKGPGGHSWGDFGEANPHHALGRAVVLFSERAPSVTGQGPKSSFNIGRIGGGTSINSIPFESWMEVDMRSGDVGKLDAVDAVFHQAMQDGLSAENAARLGGPELTVEIEKVGDRPAGKADPSSPLIQQAMAAMQTMGITPELRLSSTDANIPISMGLPAITISRGGISTGAHSFEEKWTDTDAHLAIQLALLITLAQAGHAAP